MNQCVKICHVASRPCRLCDVMLYFVPSRDGKPHPFNEDGVSHFATCPGAEEYRRRNRARDSAAQDPPPQQQEPLFDAEPLPD